MFIFINSNLSLTIFIDYKLVKKKVILHFLHILLALIMVNP
jgi:hypothetical protein